MSFVNHLVFSNIQSFSTPDDHRPNVFQPFGPRITSNSPCLKSEIDRLPAARRLREMQSFESELSTLKNTPINNAPKNAS